MICEEVRRRLFLILVLFVTEIRTLYNFALFSAAASGRSTALIGWFIFRSHSSALVDNSTQAELVGVFTSIFFFFFLVFIFFIVIAINKLQLQFWSSNFSRTEPNAVGVVHLELDTCEPACATLCKWIRENLAKMLSICGIHALISRTQFPHTHFWLVSTDWETRKPIEFSAAL